MNDLMHHIQVYLVDDDEILLSALKQSFELDDIDVVAINKPSTLLETIDEEFAGIIVTDVRMPTIDGFDLFTKVRTIDADIPVIFITGHADVPMVLNTLHEGAFDFFSKPIDAEHLRASARRAIETRRLVLENRSLKKLAQRALTGNQLIGEAPVMQRLRETVRQVAMTDIDILIEGETGTGKTLIASLIHEWSGRASRKFIPVNCAAIPMSLAEAELFGVAYNPQSLSRREQIGKIQASDRGTLFLDEIESLSLQLQGQMVPVVEDRHIRMVGGQNTTPLDLRIIAASNANLSEAVSCQEFRADLLYRLNTVKLRLPPLRDRAEDIPLLFSHFVSDATERFNKKIPKISASAMKRLLDYDWPGNVRELKNFADSIVLGIDSTNGKSLTMGLSLPERVERFEANTICSALESTGGDVPSTVQLLGIPRKTFYDKVSRHNIDINKYRNRTKKNI